MLGSYSWKCFTKENDGTVYDSHSQRKGAWKLGALEGGRGRGVGERK
jgi:hypothetical protein